MKAILIKEFGAPENLTIEESPTPKPGPDEVLIDVHAIGVNFIDLLVIAGQYQNLPALPFVPGVEVAGVVAEAGEGMTTCKPGDRVMAQLQRGGYAEQAIASEQYCYPLPEGMDFARAAAMGMVYLTAHFALVGRARLADSETVLVSGAAGGVGLASVQLARALGATVLAGVGSPDKAEVARANGAHHVIDLSGEDLKDSLRDQVRKATGGGVDIVIDPVGGDVFDASLRALASGGRIVVVGFTSGRIPNLKTNYVLLKNISVTGLHMNDYFQHDPAGVRRVQEELFRLATDEKIDPQVMQAYPMERFAEALNVIRDRRVMGKIVLTTGHESV